MKTTQLSKTTLDFLEPTPLPFYLNGEWITSSSTIEVIAPATTQQVATIALATASDINESVDKAAVAFKAWSTETVEFRATRLRKLADLITRDAQILAELECIDVGKPISARGS